MNKKKIEFTGKWLEFNSEALFLTGFDCYRVGREDKLFLIKICLALFIDCRKNFTPTHSESYESSGMLFRIVKVHSAHSSN